MTELLFNSELALKQIIDILSPVAITKMSYPVGNAKFPLIIVSDPLQKPKQMRSTVDLQFSIEVWHIDPFQTMKLFDSVVLALHPIGLRLASSTTNFKDLATENWRKNGTFEVRYNTQNNHYEINR